MITFKVVTPNGVTYEDQITGVTLPTQQGVITVLEDHMPLVSLLAPGEIIVYKEKDKKVNLAVSTGLIEVKSGNKVYLLADTAERAEDIDIEKAEKARKKAEKAIEEGGELSEIDYSKLQAIIQRESARIQIGKKYKKLKV